MKKLSYFLCIMALTVIMPTSCKDDDDDGTPPAPDLLLTKIERNGVTKLELTYDTDKKLTRMNYYVTTGELSSYTLYEYNDQGIQESRRYDGDDHALEYRTVFTLDNFGRIIKGENYTQPDFDEVASISTFSYDPSGQVTKHDFVTPGNPIYSRLEFTYGTLGHPTRTQRTLYPNQPEERLSFQIDYTPDDRLIPSHWNDYTFLLAVQALEEFIWEMFNTSSHTQLWNSSEELNGETRTDATQQEFNSSGYLTRQVLTQKNLLNPGSDGVREMTYEYTQ